jgi:hypothetical protein
MPWVRGISPIQMRLMRGLPSFCMFQCGSKILVGQFWFGRNATEGTFVEVDEGGTFGKELVRHFNEVFDASRKIGEEVFPDEISLARRSDLRHLFYESSDKDGNRFWRYIDLGELRDSEGHGVKVPYKDENCTYRFKRDPQEEITSVHMWGLTENKTDHGMMVFPPSSTGPFARILAGAKAHRGFDGAYCVSPVLLSQDPFVRCQKTNTQAGPYKTSGTRIPDEDLKILRAVWRAQNAVSHGLEPTLHPPHPP